MGKNTLYSAEVYGTQQIASL